MGMSNLLPLKPQTRLALNIPTAGVGADSPLQQWATKAHADPAAPGGGGEVGQRRELRQRVGALHDALRPAHQQSETLQIGGGADLPQVL